MGGGSPPTNTTQNLITTQNLPAWYQDYLQNVIGRASSEAGGEAPVYSGSQVAGLTANQNAAIQQIQGGNNISPYFNQGFNYLNQSVANSPLSAAQPYFQQGANAFSNAAGLANQAGNTNIAGAMSPYLNQAQGLIGQGTNTSLLGIANPYINQAVSGQGAGLSAASPYLNAASQSLPQATMNNLSPYLGGAMDALSNQGAYDLQNKYLPAVNDSFIKAGQFGSTRNQDITAQTIHDLSNSVMNQQAGLINSAYGQAGQLAEQNLGLQGQLAQTAGGLGTAQQQALLGAGSTLGTLGGAQAGLQLQGAGQTAGLGSQFGNALNQQGQLQLGAAGALNQTGSGYGQYGSAAGGLQNAFNQSLMNAGMQTGNLAAQYQTTGLQGANALYAAGTAQQQNDQQSLNTAYQDWLNQTFYPQNQTSFLSGIVRGNAPAQSPSYTQTTQNPTNPGAQIGGLLTAGLNLAGGANTGGYTGYTGYRRGGAAKFKMGGKVSYERVAATRKGLGQFREAA